MSESTKIDWVKEIGRFKPKRFQYSQEVQWTTFVKLHMPEGFYLYGYPEFRGRNERVDHDVREWHHDLNEEVRGRTYLIVWATARPTQIRHINTSGIATPAPHVAVMFRNDRWEHRQPEMTNRQLKRRCFARAWVTRDHDLALNYFAEEAF